MTPSTPETDPVVDEVTDTAPLPNDTPDTPDTDMSETLALDPLAAVTQERDEYLDDLRRARAEFENYRKRMANEGAVQRTLGRHDVVTALLEFSDDLDRLVDAAIITDTNDLAHAVNLLANKWRQALTGLNIARIEDTGVAFDPNEHDAVSQIPADEPTETPVVAEVMRVGYRSGERVLRPAIVVVAQ